MSRQEIQEKVAALGDLSRPDLVKLWTKHYGCPPPSGVRMPLLVRAVASHLQERQLGGLSSYAKRLLKVAMKQVGRDAAAHRPVGDMSAASAVATGESHFPSTSITDSRPDIIRPLPLPGARLIRDWNGRRYVVDVVDTGFVLDGKSYRSLSAIAFRITGTKWSGPRFFGL